MSRGSHIQIAFLDGLFYVMFVVIIGMLGYLAQEHQYQSDWTFGQRNTLTETTQQLLRSIDEPVSFIAYVPDDVAMHSDIKKRIAKYQKFKSDVSLEMVNPELDPERAKKDGISYQGQLVVRLGEQENSRQEVVESLAESSLANVLQRLSRGASRLVVFLEGHDERQPFVTQSTGMSQLTNLLKNSGFNIQPHSLVRTQSLPDETSLLVIAAPKQDLLEGEVAIIKKYVQQGGNLLWLHEPGSLHGLGLIEETLGLKIDEGTLVDANEELRDLLGIKHPAVIPVVNYNGAGVSKAMTQQTLFPFATSINRDEELESDWNYEDFLLSLPTSWLEVDELAGDVVFESDTGDKPGPLVIGVSLSRRLKQGQALIEELAEERIESDQTTQPDKQSTEASNQPLSEPSKQQRVIVVGDSDFMLNAFVGQVGNLDLSISIFNWLVADDNLVAIKAISAPDTRLNLEPIWLYSIGLFFLIILPLLLVLMGVMIWYLRRKK